MINVCIEHLINVSIEHPHVRSLELQVREIQHPLQAYIETVFCGQGTPLGAMGGLACAAVVHLVRVMRSNGCRLDFLGLTGTMLGDGEERLLADALNALPARDPAAEAETIKLLQVYLSEPVRCQLTAAGTRAGVKVLLSRVNGQALRIR